MSTRWFQRDASAFHPELRTLSRVLPRGPVSARSLPFVRSLVARSAPTSRRGVLVVPVGDVSVRLHVPPGHRSGTTRPAILWIHGGGYVIGTAAQDDAICRRLARRHGAIVAAVDYRLAPEHPFPVPLDDCHDALVWLAGRADVDAERVVIAGASAGGGLAAGLAQLARTRGVVAPALQVLVYPMIDDRTVVRDVDERNLRLWSNASNRFGWRSYTRLEPGDPGQSAPAVPARCDDLAGLAPAWIGVGTCDLFHDEDVAYAERLRAAGVACDLEIVEGAYHGFDAITPKTSVTRDFWASQDAAIDRALGATASVVRSRP